MRRSCLLVCAGFLAMLGIAASGAAAAPPGFQGEHADRGDLDSREGRAAPTARQRAGAAGLRVTWNRFGTPQSLAESRGFLARGLASDEVTAAQQWIERNRDVLGISAESARELELVSSAPVGAGRAVMLRQRFGELPAGRDGLIVVAVSGGNVAYVSSTLTSDTALSGAQRLQADDAVRAAARDADISLGGLANARQQRGWTALDATGLARPAQARLVALPTPNDGVRRAWETSLADNGLEPRAFATLVDAETGGVLMRENLVDHLADNPQWSVFPNTPPMNYASTDTRVRWCWLAGPAGCALVVGNTASPVAWDVDAGTNAPTFTTKGNNAFAVHNWFSINPFTVGVEPATSRPDREYTYTWTNQWREQRCNPTTTFTSPQRNDIDAARANLFAMHNRMHDWSYHLGFTEQTWNLQSFNFGRGGAENDPELGNAQAGGVTGGPPGFAARDNANQITFADGTAPITNMYLWQPIAAAFYAPCVDGDYDMSVIAHEYTHAISNRMAAGPNANLSGSQAGAMGESWSDLAAVEYLQQNGFAPVASENPYAVGPYVTGDPNAGIRNYGMNASPLNFSDVGYDFVCNQATCPILTQVHADGEIWSAINYDIRQAFAARYGTGNTVLQVSCARGERPASQCPGNRRWTQLMFDAWLLMATGQVSMVDARNALIAADQLRFNGINADILWNAFARRGIGQQASSNGTDDADPVPSFDSPFADEATVRFRPSGQAGGEPAQLFVGHYEARVTPIADTDPGTPLDDTFSVAAGTYDLIARANGFGARRLTLTVRAGQLRDLRVDMDRNLASGANGATATGDGTNVGKLIDDTEATNWASIGSPIAGKQVTVQLDPSRQAHVFRRVQVSALLRTRLPADPGGDTAAQNRFTALRQFELLACEARGTVDCTQAAHFQPVFTSPADAFPSGVPRPRAPEMIMRSFDVPRTRASHVRLRVLTNQCTGTPAYQGDQDDDPGNVTDCDDGSTADDSVRAAELQVFAR